MVKNNKICGGVVLYNPDLDILKNIHTYIDQVQKLFIVDNSDRPDPEGISALRKFKNTRVLFSGKNLGIAAALNIIAKEAEKEGFDFLLTMDQDSYVPPNMVSNLVRACKKANIQLSTVGILSPYQYDSSSPVVPDSEIDELPFVITSGNLLNLKAYHHTGDFCEKLFIDRVDHEYCIRLRIAGYKILRVNTVMMEHNLGNITRHTFLGRTQYVTNHAPVRRYYMIRNGLFVANKFKDTYPEYYCGEKKLFLYEIIKILLFEKNRMKKIWYCLQGYIDYRRKRFGRYDEIHTQG